MNDHEGLDLPCPACSREPVAVLRRDGETLVLVHCAHRQRLMLSHLASQELELADGTAEDALDVLERLRHREPPMTGLCHRQYHRLLAAQ